MNVGGYRARRRANDKNLVDPAEALGGFLRHISKRALDSGMLEKFGLAGFQAVIAEDM